MANSPSLFAQSNQWNCFRPIQPGQRPIETPSLTITPTSWKVIQKTPEDYERDRVGKYGLYFQGNVILPIPKVANVLKPWIVSLVVVDIKNRRFAGLKKDTFEELLRTPCIPGQYFCRSFATWDVLLPTKEQAANLIEICISTKFFRLQPEYFGTRRIRVTNVPAIITGEIVASFLSAYGWVENITQLRAAAGTTHGDYVFRVYLDREGFQAILDTIYKKDKQMMVVVEGRRPHCWNCKQVGHIAKVCLQKTSKVAETTQPPKPTEDDARDRKFAKYGRRMELWDSEEKKKRHSQKSRRRTERSESKQTVT